MTEDYLHYIWKFSKFSNTSLASVNGEAIEIVRKGFHNHNAGPDFLEGQIYIDGTLWAGSVEIHIKTSHWKQHNHQNDERYNNVVLHVVYEHDKEVYNKNGDTIPVLELKDKIDEKAYFLYEQFLNKGKLLPCQNSFLTIPSLVLNSCVDAMLIERLERKSKEVIVTVEKNRGDWEETFHQFLFKYMGMKVNSLQMSELAERLPLQLLNKESNSLMGSEALIFGQSGLLEIPIDNEYHKSLRNEYLYLKQKHSLQSMRAVVWKFSRMRPPNFPTLRMAQLAAIYTATRQLFQIVREKLAVNQIGLILDVETSDFWKTNYSFTSQKNGLTTGKIGKSTLDALVINLIVPFSFAYGRSVGDESYEEYAFDLLNSLKPEKNTITKKMEAVGFENESAKDSQSLIQLNNEYCMSKKCLNCKIGVYLLQ